MKDYKVVFHWSGNGYEPPTSVKEIFQKSFVEQYNKYCEAMNSGVVEKANAHCEKEFGTTNCDDKRVWDYHLAEANRVVNELYKNGVLSDGTKEFGRGSITYYVEPIDMNFVMKINFFSNWKNELNIYLVEG